MHGNPGTLEHTLAVAWLLGAAVVMSNAAGATLPVLAVAFAALFLTAVWILRAFIAKRRGIRPKYEQWLAWPAAFLFAIILHFTQVPRIARLKYSEPALLEAIEENRGPGRYGLFSVSRIEHKRDGHYLVTQKGMFGVAGFAYIPSNIPVPDGRSMKQVFGHWWAFRYED